MSSKFFTNQDGNTLSNRLRDILSDYPIANAEFLIGYLRISGFSHIADLIGNVKKARILVGIDVDKFIVDAKRKAQEANLFNNELFSDAFITQQQKELSDAPYIKSVEQSVSILSDLLKSGGIELRIARDKNIHAKIYILREETRERNDGRTDHRGSVITGSSNLSENGLERNFEFNVELRDSDEISFSLNEFEKLWKDAIEIRHDDIANVAEKSYLKEVTPFEVYMKFLIEHFGERIEFDPTLATLLPPGYYKLAYQMDAVQEGVTKIRAHGGFFLADVVGLGKTITASMIVKKLLFETRGKVLIIAPPSIQKEWEETFRKLQIGQIRHYDFKSYRQLDKVKEPEEYEIVIIDESHKFKNIATAAYSQLERICKERSQFRKKIILISATPFNNKPADIANQLYLFQNKRASTIDSHPNLESFFGQISKEYDELLKKDNPLAPEVITSRLTDLAGRMRDQILRYVMVRRTRSDLKLERYRADIEAQGLTTPRVNPINEIVYLMSDPLAKAFEQSVTILGEAIQYSHYQLLAALNEQGRKKYGKAGNIFELSSENLAKIIKTMMIKRLESSFHALKESIRRQINHLHHLIGMFEAGEIYLVPSIDFAKLFDEEDEIIEQKALDLIDNGKAKLFHSSDFNDGFVEKLQADLDLFVKLDRLWDGLNDDPKLDTFSLELQKQKGKKLVVFTESKDTALYLHHHLKDKGRMLIVHGGNREEMRELVRENFDPNYATQKDEYDVIITTDALSEGVNMHRANIVYNYDIPWNSTRLMQRIGRINRIGTPHSEIFVHNFIPSAQSDAVIDLTKKAFVKLQTFHATLGEDNPVFIAQEQVGTKAIFTGEEDKPDVELVFLEELRAFRDGYPKRFRTIKELPQKVRVQRRAGEETFVFVKSSESKSYYCVKESEALPITFVQMAEKLRAEETEQGISPLIERHYDDVKIAIEAYEAQFATTAVQTQTIKIAHKLDKEALILLKSWREKAVASRESLEMIMNALQQGRFANLAKALRKLKGENPSIIEAGIKKIIIDYGLRTDIESTLLDTTLPVEIILSETFIG
jgi:superfamily II DNA or RNA helicase